MWALVVLVAMAAAIGSLIVSQEARTQPVVAVVDDHLARNMAVYRRVVMEHVRANPSTNGSVGDEVLAFPAWYARNPAWRNTVLPGGTVVVYADRDVSPTLVTRLAEMSRGSVLAGEVRRRDDGQPYLYTPNRGDTGIDLPALSNGTVVWLARAD